MPAHKLRRGRGRVGLNAKLDASDVFSTYLYTGNGSTQTIVNGIDLAGKGGLVWCKDRTNATSHALFDTLRGINLRLTSNDTLASTNLVGSVTSFNNNGFSIGSQNAVNNPTNGNFSSWTFRKAPKFFDVVTFTGTGSLRTIQHNLGIKPGMIIIKSTSNAYHWDVYHQAIGATKYLRLNLTDASAIDSAFFNNTEPTATEFTVNTAASSNGSGATYVAYLFAHDTSADGIIQCGSFTTDGSGNATVELGWEPQFVLIKRTDTTGSWYLLDTMRGWSQSSDPFLLAQAFGAETTGFDFGSPNATGFNILNSIGSSGAFIYLTIRRPNKVPTSGTEVYNAVARTGTGAVTTVSGVGFAPDLMLSKRRTYTTQTLVWDRLRGVAPKLLTQSTAIEDSSGSAVQLLSFEMNSVKIGTDSGFDQINMLGEAQVDHFFKRAKGFFDVVCYTGTGVARTVNHNLGVVPELMIVKSRNIDNNWIVYHSAMTATSAIYLSTTGAKFSNITVWNNTEPTPTQFTTGTVSMTNDATGTFIAYLFATLAGVSKVGSYTGNGTAQTINCGFSTGARFVLIKRTDSTGDWYIWDTARGIVAANDPHLSLNTTAAEVTTDDSIDPAVEGFICNQNTATNINVTSATYIYLAIS